MAIIQAWKCLKTGKLFESERAYKKHRRQLAVLARNLLMNKRSLRNYEHDLQELVEVERSLSMLMDAFIAKQGKFWARAKQLNNWIYGRKDFEEWPELVEVNFRNITYRDRVSNSHSRPVGGVTNWSGDPNKPRGYPGWTGNIDFKYRYLKKASGYYPGGALFAAINVHTGTGGGGGHIDDPTSKDHIIQSYSYGVEIFAHDHPGLWKHHARQVEQKRRAAAWKAVGGREFVLPALEDDWEPPALPSLEEYLVNPSLNIGYEHA